MNQIDVLVLSHVSPKPYTAHMLTFQHILRNQCSKDSCVCVVGVAIFGLLFDIWVLIAHGLKSAYKTVYVLVEWMWVVAWNPHSMFCI